jgi:hypothetical protein
MDDMTQGPLGAFADQADTGDTGPDRRKSLLLAGAAAAVLAGGGFFLLAGGDDAEEDFALPPRAAAAAPQAAAPPPAELPATTEVSFARNPFEPQYIEPKAASGGSGTQGGGTQSPTDTPPQILQQSDPAFVPPQPSFVVVQQPAQQTPTSTQPPAPAPVQPQPAPEPADDGVRYPITLMALNVVKEGDPGKYVSWGWEKEGFEVLPGQPFGRFKHLRVMQVVETAEKQGVMLQMGDGSPYFVAVGETVYVL